MKRLPDTADEFSEENEAGPKNISGPASAIIMKFVQSIYQGIGSDTEKSSVLTPVPEDCGRWKYSIVGPDIG